MAHDHHHGESLRDYFTEQLLTILVCGVFGIAAIQMYVEKKMEFLAPQFHPWVLGGGISIIAMVILRAIVVWREAGEYQAQAAHVHGTDCGTDHTHGPDCNHVHIPGQEAHDHDHG